MPAITRVRQGLNRSGLLYVGDCKMASLETRLVLAAGGDYYLCPLPMTTATKEFLSGALEDVFTGSVAPAPIYRRRGDGEREHIAEGFEHARTVSSTFEGEVIRFTERLLVVRSLKHAKAQAEALTRPSRQGTRCRRGPQQDRARPQASPDSRSSPRARSLDSQALWRDGSSRGPVPGADLEWHEVRAYGDRPQRLRAKRQVTMKAQIEQAALARARERLGWRVYVTNQAKDVLPLEKAVRAYRNQYRIEHGMGRLKGYPLSLSPLYVQRDDHVRGLVRLLSLGLRALILLEHQVRERLAEGEEVLSGLVPVHRTATTSRPTAERLKAFEYITLTRLFSGGEKLQHVTPLTAVQQRVLALLDLSPELYLRPALRSAQPP